MTTNWNTITTTTGATKTVNNVDYVVGELYDKKTKAGKDSPFVLAFSKVDDQWRFDGWADIDETEFKTIDDLVYLLPLAFRAAVIALQSDIRPGKSTKVAEKRAANVVLKARLDNEEITIEEYMVEVTKLIG